jgi:hypothetical protein
VNQGEVLLFIYYCQNDLSFFGTYEGVDNCYDSGLITDPKISHINLISAIFSASPIVPALGELRAPSLTLDWLIKRPIKVGARVSYLARRWSVHVASAFPLAHQYRAVLAWGS